MLTDRPTQHDRHAVYLDHENKIKGQVQRLVVARTDSRERCVLDPTVAQSNGQRHRFKWYAFIFLDF